VDGLEEVFGAFPGHGEPTDPLPEPITFGKGDILQTLVPLNVRDKAGTKGKVLSTLPVGVEVRVDDGPQDADGFTWWQVSHTLDTGTVQGWVARGADGIDYVTRVREGDPEPPADEYAKPSPIPELAGLPAYLKLANGAQLIYVGYTGEVTQDTPMLRWATEGSGKVAPDAKAGDLLEVAYLIINADGSLWYYTHDAARVRFEDVEPLFADVDAA
jgi:hypothetical protein